MQNKLPNVFIDPKQFDNFNCIHAYEDKELGMVEYVPRERLDLAVAALKQIRDEGRTIDASYIAKKCLEEIGE